MKWFDIIGKPKGRDLPESLFAVSHPASECDNRLRNLAQLILESAMMRFQHCYHELPLFELKWQSLKMRLRQNRLPKAHIATYGLPTAFASIQKKRQAAYTCTICFCSSRSQATRQGYVAMSPHS